ncbi:divalent metal cation transporter, partial [Arthrospira platensis SPKY1]|nr:divalent metal cation transporter [Arthrospira platensis SPKY1]
ALMGIMGIVTDLLQEGIRLLNWGEVGTLPINAVLVVGLFVLLFYGRYQLFEKILTVFVILMGLCFVLVFFLVRPDFGEVARGLIPSIPRQPGALGLVAAMAGTT